MGKTDIGPPDFWDMLPEAIKRNYGTWKYHEHVRPGVLKHVSESGEQLYTIRAGSTRLLSIDFIRNICDIADEFCDGHLRFTSRSNIEFMTTDEWGYRLAGQEIPSPILSIPRGGFIVTARQQTHQAS